MTGVPRRRALEVRENPLPGGDSEGESRRIGLLGESGKAGRGDRSQVTNPDDSPGEGALSRWSRWLNKETPVQCVYFLQSWARVGGSAGPPLPPQTPGSLLDCAQVPIL